MGKSYFSGPSNFDEAFRNNEDYWSREGYNSRRCCPDNDYNYYKWECDKREKRKNPSFLAATANAPTGTQTGDITLQFSSLTGAGGENITPFGSTAFNLTGGKTYLVQISASLNIPSPVASGDPVNPTLQLRVGGTSSLASVAMIGTDINAPVPTSSDLFTATLYAYVTVPRNTVQSIQAIITGFSGLNVTAIAGSINILEI